MIVDEVHVFAGDDRGWHLLAVLERLRRIIAAEAADSGAGRPELQVVGLSATVGNPADLLRWLQGSGVGRRPGLVVAPDVPVATASAAGPPPGEIELDYIGSVPNAAKVLATLHQGEKRLVFCDSKQLVEQLGSELRARGVTTFLSHASLSVDERRRSEEAFTQARDCVIVTTSTLELGIDVGDLDRVIQLNAPSSVASFLQRLGRTGRRSGTVRNCLFLTLTQDALVQAAGLLLLWGRGWVEPVVAPPEWSPPEVRPGSAGARRRLASLSSAQVEHRYLDLLRLTMHPSVIRHPPNNFRRRPLSHGTSSPSNCSPTACRRTRSATGSGPTNGTASRPSTGPPNRSSLTSFAWDSSTPTAACCS
nr:helicase-related protein [Frankia sp. Cj5]